MIRYITLVLASFWMVACSAHDERYYLLHPKYVQKALENCPQQRVKDLSCEQLQSIALRLNNAAMELQINPQAYGKEILDLQQLIAIQQSDLKINQGPSSLKASLDENKRKLQERLAIVKWLESPVG